MTMGVFYVINQYQHKIMQKLRICVIIASCYTLLQINGVTAQRQPQLTLRQKQDISSFINTVMSCRNIPGMNLAIVNKDQVLMSKGFGFSDLDANRQVTRNTLFPIASNSKAFTATLLAIILHSEANTKNFTWDSPIRQILGESFELYNAYLTEKTTIRDILSHKTGIPDYFLGLMAGFPATETRANLVKRLRFHRPVTEFRTKLEYNNYMYGLAGYVSEQLMGGSATWEDLVRTHIVNPLGMTSTTTTFDVEDLSDIATPYVLYDGTLHPVDTELVRQTHPAQPAGSILSTAVDMSKWLQFHLNEGQISGEPLLPKEKLQETYMPQMPSTPPLNKRDISKPTYPITDVNVAYDMAWETNFHRGFKRIWHSGSIATFKSQVWFYPDLGFGMYCTCNGPPSSGSSWALRLILQYIADLLMGEEPWITAEGACKFPAPYKEEPEEDPTPVALPQDTPPHEINKYVGTYNHPGFGDITITVKTSPSPHLFLSMGRFLRAQLFYNASDNRFYTNLTGVYWYMNDRIPIHFQSSAGYANLDILNIPMHSPFESTKPFSFMRGNAQANRQSGPNQSYKYSCTSTSATQFTSYVPATLFGSIFISYFMV